MPELAEVEIVKRTLEKDLISLEIKDIDVRYEKMLNVPKEEFISYLKNEKILSLFRRGKLLGFKLSNNKNLLSHLRMEGKYFYENSLLLDNKHVHIVFKLSNGFYLMYQDTRKFGRMWIKNDDEVFISKPYSDIGYDPILDSDFNLDDIYKKIKSKHVEIKQTLLDQSIIAGLGNIYVDEVLFESRINPHKKSNKLKKSDVNNIIINSKTILEKAILNNGTTIKSFTLKHGVKGNYQEFLKVHTKSVCPCCKSNLICDKISGRTTYYCQVCQR